MNAHDHVTPMSCSLRNCLPKHPGGNQCCSSEGHSALFIRTQHSRQGGKQGWNLESNCCEIGSTHTRHILLLIMFYLFWTHIWIRSFSTMNTERMLHSIRILIRIFYLIQIQIHAVKLKYK